MAFQEPVLLKRIPQDAAKRKTFWYDDYVASGGYKGLKAALQMQPPTSSKPPSTAACAVAVGRASRQAKSGRSSQRKTRPALSLRQRR